MRYIDISIKTKSIRYRNCFQISIAIFDNIVVSPKLINNLSLPSGEKPYVCTVAGCGKRFTEYSSLYKHHVVHTHSKPYICEHCGKNYRQTSTLAMHKRTAHGDVEDEMEDQNQFLAVHTGEYRDHIVLMGFNLVQWDPMPIPFVPLNMSKIPHQFHLIPLIPIDILYVIKWDSIVLIGFNGIPCGSHWIPLNMSQIPHQSH